MNFLIGKLVKLIGIISNIDWVDFSKRVLVILYFFYSIDFSFRLLMTSYKFYFIIEEKNTYGVG